MVFLQKLLGRSKKEVGNLAELAVQRYLVTQGLKLITTNFNCRSGEIDLIMLDQKHLVFVEVRYRRSSVYGNAIESVTYNKQQRIKRAANVYLLKNNLVEKQACRFDIVAVTHRDNEPQFQWIKNAFN